MKKLILIFMLLCGSVWAGTEEHDPTGDLGSQWTGWNCVGSHASCISDDDNATGIYVDDNAQNGYYDKFIWDNTAVSDSIIDSVRYILNCSTTVAGSIIAVIDSLSGYAIRQSSDITLTSTIGFNYKYVAYTTSPAGAAWTWADIDALMGGVLAVSIVDKNKVYVNEAWFTVYYHPEAGVTGQAIMITGD